MFLAVPAAGTAATFTVNSANDVDDGACGSHCSLREAINAANTISTTDTIAFNIPLPPFTIKPASALPAIADPVVIDGTTQPGFATTPIIELDGSLVGIANGLRITAGGSTVRGLVINRFSSLGHAGILLELGDGNVIEGNFIGTNTAGAASAPNDLGILIELGSSGNRIGGSTAGASNLISGNNAAAVSIETDASGNHVQGNLIGTNANGTVGLPNLSGVVVCCGASDNIVGGAGAGQGNVISSNDNFGVLIVDATTFRNEVKGNFIGTDVTGSAALGNGIDGVRIASASGNVIGGTGAGARNVISGNGQSGVILRQGATGNSVQGNFIGTDASGSGAIPNGSTVDDEGVRIQDASANTIGGTTPGARNVISGNWAVGVRLISAGTVGNTIQGNFIGTDASGTAPLENKLYGVSFSFGASANTIGGTAPGAGNTIAFNGENGVRVVNAVGNAVLSNSIFSNEVSVNSGLGIDLIPPGALEQSGVTPNDAGDADTGGNNLQNFPVLTSVVGDLSSTTIEGTLSSRPNTSYRLEFFSNSACDPKLHGEGERILGSRQVTTGADGSVTFSHVAPTSLSGQGFVTATATDPDGNTSEFSRCKEAVIFSGYPRPQAGAQLRVPLAVAYEECGDDETPNRTHGPGLEEPSCNPATQQSDYLAVGSTDANSLTAQSVGFVKLTVCPSGTTATGACSTPSGMTSPDVRIEAKTTDVRCKGGVTACQGGLLSDYTGELRAEAGLRITDRDNSSTPGGSGDPATVEDGVYLPFVLNCAANEAGGGPSAIGATCSVLTRANAVLPGAIVPAKRANWEIETIEVRDGGADGDVDTAPNTVFERQGIFIP